MPANIRNIKKCPIEDFKIKLDKFLECTPDEPSVRGLALGACTAEARASNYLVDQVRRVQMARDSQVA